MTSGFRISSWLLGFLTSWLLFSPSASAQSTPDLLAVDSAFVSQQYEKAELLALRILQGNYVLTSDAKARLNLTMGYSAIMLGHEDDARVDFARALDAVPNLELDPVQVSPKFRVVFEDVKARRKNEGGISKGELGMADVRVNRRARLVNLILPGSGQWLEGRPWRGAVVFGLQAAATAVLIWQSDETSKARRDYLAQADVSLMKHDYDRYNRNYQRTWIAGIATGIFYLASQADLVWMKPKTKSLKFSIAPTESGIEVALIW